MRAAIRMVNLGMPIKGGDGTSSAIPFPSTPNVAQAFFARVGPRSGPPCFLLPPTNVGAMSQAWSRHLEAPAQPLAAIKSNKALPTVGAAELRGTGQLKKRETELLSATMMTLGRN